MLGDIEVSHRRIELPIHRKEGRQTPHFEVTEQGQT